jgi:ribosomal protein S18 acetylase RimI-like enzyme
LPQITLRPATPDDIEVTYDIKRQAFGPYIQQAYGWDEDDQRRRHGEEFNVQDTRMVQLDGEAVGYLRAKLLPHELYVSQVFILPAHQGKRIGAACMQMVIAEARREAIPVRLQVLKLNPRALSFYESLGFTQVGETPTHIQLELGLQPR